MSLSPTEVIIKGQIFNNGEPLSGVNIDFTSAGINNKLTNKSDGTWEITLPIGNFNPDFTEIVFTKEGYQLETINKLIKLGEENDKEQYVVARVTLDLEPDSEGEANNMFSRESLQQESQEIIKQSKEKLDATTRILVGINAKKGDLKNILLPAIIKLLAPFGALALQAITKKLPIDKILSLCKCPPRNKILKLIEKRNKLAKSINNIYDAVKSISSVLTTIETIITAVQVGILAIEILPAPAQFATIGVIETLGSVKDSIKDLLKLAKVGVNLVNMTLSTFGIILGIILKLLNILDALVAKCVEDQNIPFDVINDELNLFVNDSTGISNSRVIAELNNTSPPQSELSTPEIPGFDSIKIFLDEQNIINNQLFIETQNATSNARAANIAATAIPIGVILKSLTNNTATLTTNVPHNYSVGQSLTITGIDNIFNGIYTITAVTSDTFSYFIPNTSTGILANISITPVSPPGTSTIKSTTETTGLNLTNFSQPNALNQALTTLINNDPTIAGAFGNSILNSLGVVNPTQDGKYRGFTLEIKLDESNNSKYPRRFAQALNVQGVPVLKTESSFASDPQVLLNELKFIIDSSPNLSAV
jgi:hypothetical protein